LLEPLDEQPDLAREILDAFAADRFRIDDRFDARDCPLEIIVDDDVLVLRYLL